MKAIPAGRVGKVQNCVRGFHPSQHLKNLLRLETVDSPSLGTDFEVSRPGNII